MSEPIAIYFSPDYDEDELPGGERHHDDIDEAEIECGLTDEGVCMLAGTEHCDFECPYRDCLT